MNLAVIAKITKSNWLPLSSLVLFIFSLFSIKNTYQNLSQKVSHLIVKEIEEVLQDNEQLLSYVGQQIISSDEITSQKTFSIIKELHKLNFKSMTNSYVSWATQEGKISVSGKAGYITKDHTDICNRSYYKSAKHEPWKLKVSEINRSLFSNKIIIPTALGINKNGDFKGFLILGLIHDELVNNIIRSINAELFDFVVFLNNKTFLNTLTIESRDLLENNKNKMLSALCFSINYEFKDSSGVLYLGMQPKNFMFWLLHEILIYLPLYIVLMMAYLIKTYSLYITRSIAKILHTNQYDSEEELSNLYIGNDLLRNVWLYKSSIQKDMALSEIINSNFKYFCISLNEKEKFFSNYQQKLSHSISLLINRVSQYSGVGDCDKVIQDRFNFIINDLERIKENDWLDSQITNFNVNSIIEECLTFHLKKISDLGIIIKKNLKTKDLFFSGNQDAVKNLILSVISFSAGCIISKGEIQIYSETESTNFHKVIRIFIKYISKSNLDINRIENAHYSKVISEYGETLKSIIVKSRKIDNMKCFHQNNKQDNSGEFVLELYQSRIDFKDNVTKLNTKRI